MTPLLAIFASPATFRWAVAELGAVGFWGGVVLAVMAVVTAWFCRTRVVVARTRLEEARKDYQDVSLALERVKQDVEVRVRERTESVKSGLRELQEEIAERRFAQDRLQRQLAFDHLLANVSTDFVRVQSEHCHQMIRESLPLLQDFLAVDAIAVFEFALDGQSVQLVSESCCREKATFSTEFHQQRCRKVAELPTRALWNLAQRGKQTVIADVQTTDIELKDDDRRYFRTHEIRSILQMPIRVEDSVLGFIGLRSRANGADWDPGLIPQMELVAQVFASALHRKRTDEELVKLQRFGTLISKLSGNFVDLPAEKVENAIAASLGQIGEFIGAARCSIYQVTDDLAFSERLFHWEADQATDEIGETKRLSLSYFPWFHQCYREGTAIAMGSIYDIPSYAAPERVLISKLRAKSFLAMPMRLAGRTIGHVGFCMDSPSHPWSSQLMDQMRLVAELFANALERQRKETALAESELRYQTIVEDQTQWLLRWRPDGTRVFVNQSYCDRCERTAEALLGTNVYLEIHPEECERLRSQVAALTPENPVITIVRQVRRPAGETSWEQWTDRAFFDDQGEMTEIQSVGFDMTEEKLAEEQAAALQREFQQTLIDSQEAERARIARELHDELGQSLTALRLNVRAMQKNLEAGGGGLEDAASFASTLEGMIGLVDTTIPEVRRICAELRPSILDNLGLVAAMEWQLDKFQENTKIRCNQGFLLSELPSHPRRDIAMFRIFQELLTNVARHAKASEIWTSLRLDEKHQLVLEVRDDGRGISEEDMRVTTHFGLLGVRERAAFIDGKVEIQGKPNLGTTATVTIPAPDLILSSD